MTRFQAEIEFSLDWDDASIEDAESELKAWLYKSEPLAIKSIKKISITPKEALNEISQLLSENNSNVSFADALAFSRAVQHILSQVA